MHTSTSTFDGSWWWPQWNTSSLPFPPEPQLANSIIKDGFYLDLELGLSTPLPEQEGISIQQYYSVPHGYYEHSEQELLSDYPKRLGHYARLHDIIDPSRDLNPATHPFTFLRYYDLQRITHKLMHLNDLLKSGVNLSQQDAEELNTLLRDQGTSPKLRGLG